MTDNPIKMSDFTKPNDKSAVAKARIKTELNRRQTLIRTYKRKFRLICSFLVIVCFDFIGYIYLVNMKPGVVPNSIQSQVQFPIFYPHPTGRVLIKTNTFKYSKSLGQVSFIVYYDSSKITFAEQASPDAFSADPSYYQNFVRKLHSYITFQSVNGQVDIVKPGQINEQGGVMNAKGTLLFATTNSQISENSWKALFNSLTNTQPN